MAGWNSVPSLRSSSSTASAFSSRPNSRAGPLNSFRSATPSTSTPPSVLAKAHTVSSALPTILPLTRLNSRWRVSPRPMSILVSAAAVLIGSSWICMACCTLIASGRDCLSHQRFGQLRVFGAGGSDAGFELVAEGEELCDLGDDAVLVGQPGELDR
jgi:hypothetical protein